MILELANAISFRGRKYQKFDVPKNSFSRPRYEEAKNFSIRIGVRAGNLRTFPMNPKTGTRVLGRFPFREGGAPNEPICRPGVA